MTRGIGVEQDREGQSGTCVMAGPNWRSVQAGYGLLIDLPSIRARA